MLDGEKRRLGDPIQLAWMVKEIAGYARAAAILFTIQASWIWMGSGMWFLRDVLAHHLVHHPHKADGVRNAQHQAAQSRQTMHSIAYAIVVFSGAMLIAAAQFVPNPDGLRFATIVGVITLACGFGLLLRDKRE